MQDIFLDKNLLFSILIELVNSLSKKMKKEICRFYNLKYYKFSSNIIPAPRYLEYKSF